MVAYPGSVVYHAPSGLENREGGKLAGPRPLAWAVVVRPFGARFQVFRSSAAVNEASSAHLFLRSAVRTTCPAKRPVA